ncbi:hypothetical protein MPC4_230061 [Methylocella tundrae]|uniref:Uncharacterized protein n=1 Tax=Methylocella tundrae TaxID=227605 RepID=A0A8B6M6P0_METTU|nr:hypothetical protein MPC1_3440002 [Methylocella tundrae]VTZ50406.1 hypothetical protein MPC4_230061 [Methylocella tundrae]
MDLSLLDMVNAIDCRRQAVAELPARMGCEEVELPTYARFRPQSAYTVLTLRGIGDNVSRSDPEGPLLSL